MTWADNATDETSYKVERSTDGSNFSPLITLGPDVITHTDTGLSGGTQYWYQVVASSASGSSAPSNIASGTTLPGAAITLFANGYKVKGKQNVDLNWTGVGAGVVVNVYRDNSPIGTSDTGDYTDAIGIKGAGSYVYQVCEAISGSCSGTVTVTF